MEKPKKGTGHYILADTTSIETATENIIKNAIEASYLRQSILVKTKFTKADVKNRPNNIEIIITDYGIGIEEDYRKKLFKAFETTKNYGSGLGLFNARESVKHAGGEIYFESKIGKGSTFIIKFAHI